MRCETCGAPHACPLQTQIHQGSSPPHGLHGIFNVNKPAGMSSHDVVSAVRRASKTARVGHAGTLDPLATGVLLLCVGQAVRVTEYLMDHDKKYRARVRLGVATDTYDATGAVVAQRQVSVTREQIADALQSFVGKVAQAPPAYSALKRAGTPLYKLARRGVKVEAAPRQIEIYAIDLRAMALPEVEFDAHCSKGTYIRSLAHDLGEKLGCGAHLTALTRTASGPFSLDDALPLDQLRDALANGYAERYLNPLDDALLQFEAIVVEPESARAIRQGRTIACGRAFTTPLLRAYSADGECMALLERGRQAGEWKPHKVFAS